MTTDNELIATISKLQFLETARANENELLAQRATWLVLSQSFLFATFAIVGGQLAQSSAPVSVARVLFHAIPILGLSIAVLVELAVAAAVYMLWRLDRQLDALGGSHDVVALSWPAMRRPVPVMVLGQLPSIIAPLGLAIVWAVLLAQPTTGR